MPRTELTRPDPEQLLRQIQAEEEYQRRGRLKIFLGYTSGVGKSFRMLDEGRRRRERGEDVVVGGLQLATPPEVQRVLRNLEIIPMKAVDGADMMDVGRIVSRHPQVCLVDGLAYDNPPGASHAQRWQDVEQLLDAGVSVIGTVNLQYIEEYHERVERITGKKVSTTLPLSFINEADELEVVDAPPEHCLRIASGGAAASQQKLSELREIALLLAADVVDRQLEKYLERHGLQPVRGAQERILVCVTPRLDPAKMMESGRRNADRFHGELFVVFLINEPELGPAERERLAANVAVARRLNAHVETLDSDDPAQAVMSFARAHGVTQIFISHSAHEGLWHRLRGSLVDRVIRAAEGIDVRVFPN